MAYGLGLNWRAHGAEWLLLIRMENSLRRHIERKMRLPDRLQRTRQGLAMSARHEELTEVEMVTLKNKRCYFL